MYWKFELPTKNFMRTFEFNFNGGAKYKRRTLNSLLYAFFLNDWIWLKERCPYPLLSWCRFHFWTDKIVAMYKIDFNILNCVFSRIKFFLEMILTSNYKLKLLLHDFHLEHIPYRLFIYWAIYLLGHPSYYDSGDTFCHILDQSNSANMYHLMLHVPLV